jgi:hypothetical protein
LAYSSAPARMYAFAGGFVGALFLVGVGWLADLARLAGGCLVALVRLATFRVLLVIVGVLEMPKEPDGPLCRVDVLRLARELSGEQLWPLRGVVQDLCPDEKG